MMKCANEKPGPSANSRSRSDNGYFETEKFHSLIDITANRARGQEIIKFSGLLTLSGISRKAKLGEKGRQSLPDAQASEVK
jgi:hypothetical protein